MALKTLEGLGRNILDANPDDGNAIAGIGAAIEKACQELPSDRREAGDTLRLALDLLKASYLGQIANRAGAMRAVAQAVEAVGASLDAASETGCRQAIEQAAAGLQRALRDEPAAPEETASLDSLVARLLVLTPGDREDLERIHEILTRLLESGKPAKGPADHLSAACAAVGEIIAGQSADAQAALAKAGRELDFAVRAQEDLDALQPPVCDPPEAEPAAAPSQAAPPPASPPAPVAPSAAIPLPAADKPSASCEPAVLPSNTDLELLKEYIVECLEHISGAEAALLTLETDPTQSEPIHTVFRAFHTIKGTSGFLNLERIQKLAHKAENLLDRARNGEIQLTGGFADLALESCDALKAMIKGLDGLQPGMELPLPANCDALLEKLADPAAAGISTDAIQRPVVPRVGDILVAEGIVSRQTVETVAAEQGSSRLGEALVRSGAASATDVAQAMRAQKQTAGLPAGAGSLASEAMVRVSTDRLDSLINMVGELVISQSMIAQDPVVLGGRSARLGRNVSQTGKIVRELQDLTMGLRMVPLKQTFQKMARLVRDLGRKSGKAVQLVTEGDETEIDRNMVEVLNDPLVHMIRNSVDHGIEAAEVRAKAGKPGTGTVSLRAYHSAGSVVIEIKDDGKGLDHQRIRAKAIERGLIDPDRELTENEAFGLIFLPGFSTAEKVTDVSGRGVGMDVVRKNVESLRGRVDVASKPGLGSTFTLRLPLTMAITDAMQVRVGPEHYLLPMVVIEQSFHPAPRTITTVTGRGECVMLRNELIPIVRLHRVFGVQGAGADPYGALLVAVEAEGERCALMVDELLSQQQVVVKSLGRSLGNVAGVSGGAILGTGRVGLILDVAGLIRLAREEVFPAPPESPDAIPREEAGVLCAAR